MTRRTSLLVLAGASAALLAVVAWAAATGHAWRLDHGVETAAAQVEGRTWDAALSVVALTASPLGSAVWAAVLVVVAVVRPRVRREVAAVVGALAAATAVELALKTAVDHPGPGRVRTLFLATGLQGGPANSFPSGHMARGVVLAAGTLAVIRAGAGARALAAGYLVVVLWSRVALREHWADDAVGGLLLGVGAVAAALAVARGGAEAS